MVRLGIMERIENKKINAYANGVSLTGPVVVFLLLMILLLLIEDYLVNQAFISHFQGSLLLFGAAITVAYLYLAFGRGLSRSAKDQVVHDHIASILNSSQEMVWAVDSQYRLLAFNEAFRSSIRLFAGHECKVGDSVLSIDVGEDLGTWKNYYDKALRGITFDTEDRVSPNAGSPLIFHNTFQPLRTTVNGQIIGVSCFSRDITWKVEQEKKLRESKEQLKMVLEGATLGIWDLDLKIGVAKYNEQWIDMLGYRADEIDGSQESWESLLYPSDVAPALEALDRHISGQTAMIDIEYRMRHKLGHWLWIQCRGKIMERDANGTPVRALGTHLDITQRKENELELKRLSLVASKTHNGVLITDAEAKIEWANEAYEKITGFGLREIMGKYPGDVVNGPETDRATLERIRQGLENRQIVREELLNYRKSGEKIWILLEITPIFDEAGRLEHFISIETDITEKKKHDSQRLLLEQAVKNVAEAVLVVSRNSDEAGPKYQLAYANDAFYKMTGYSKREVYKSNPVKLLQGPRSENERISRVFEAVANESYIEEELVSFRKNGEPFWINLALSPVGDLNSANKHYFVAIVRDINERKMGQNERQNLTNELVSRNKELQEFAQIVSHNLRAPVVNIIGLTQIFDKSQNFNEYNQKILKHMIDSARRLDTILIDLNDILQVKDSSLGSKQTFNLRQLIDQVLSSFMLQIEEAEAEIKVIGDPSLELHSIRGYFHSVVHNLTTNALKYRQAGRDLKIEISAYTTSADLVLVVKDNGLGMDLKQVKGSLFKLYKRFHSHVEGKGMGLFLVKTQLERLGGTVSVYSTKGKGTAFRVVIPREACMKDIVENGDLTA